MSEFEKLSMEKKHQLYEESVQCHEADVDFINKQYHYFYKETPLTLREDFGGTGMLACNWVEQSDSHRAWAVDLDSEPINFGKRTHHAKLDDHQKERAQYIEGNVLDSHPFKTDVTVAFNFSYFIFKKRRELLNYFIKVREGLKENGLFLIDLFGGTDSREESIEETEHDDHSYFWDCDKYNPITNECLYYIHFKVDGKKYEKVFIYDWRMWSIPELREILEDAGFSKTVVYWEGEDEDGDGDGNFYVAENEDNCESWVTYMAALT